MKPYEESLQQSLRRDMLVSSLRQKGVDDENILSAIGRVPRHLFVPPELSAKAYLDRPLPIGEDQTISQPYTVAYQTELLMVEAGMKVLEVGTGSAYQSAVLVEIGAIVYTVERRRKLYERNKKFGYLQQYSHLHFCYGDGFEGWPEAASFDRILITAAPERVPIQLMQQLEIGGMMVVPVGSQGRQQMLRITRHQHKFFEEVFDKFSFVPMLPGLQ